MTELHESDNREWSRDTQKTAALIWISFLVAAVMTLAFFAVIDPLLLVEALSSTAAPSRQLGYSIGFFFFWSGCLATGWLCLRLTRRKRQGPRPVVRKS